LRQAAEPSRRAELDAEIGRLTRELTANFAELEREVSQGTGLDGAKERRQAQQTRAAFAAYLGAQRAELAGVAGANVRATKRFTRFQAALYAGG
jgi:hypothetical protein